MKEKSKSGVEVEERQAKARKPEKTADQLLAAANSFCADVERAEHIAEIAECVLRDMCKACDNCGTCADDRKKIGCLATLNCRMAAIASVTAGIIMEGGVK